MAFSKIIQTNRVAVVAACFAFLSACNEESKAPPAASAAGNSAVPAAASSSLAELKVFGWSDYIPDTLIKEFEDENHVKVTMDYFSSNEELLAKVQANVESGAKGYDVIFPSDYMAGAMIRMGLLADLDRSKLSVVDEYAPEFKSPTYDPTLSHVIPYAWGTTGIAVNTKLAPKGVDKVTSWKNFFEAAGELSGKVTWLDDMREVLHAALLANGKHWATATEADIKLAFDYLKKQKKKMKIFTPEARPVIEAGDCKLCMAYSGEGLSCSRRNPLIKYGIPSEGATLWADNLAIPKNSANKELALKFMSKLVSAKSAKVFVEKMLYGTPNAQALLILDPGIKAMNTLFPPPNVFKTLEYLVDRPELLPSMDRQWTELKSN